MDKFKEKLPQIRKHRKVHVVTSKHFRLHRGSNTHPERPARILSTIRALETFNSSDFVFVSPRPIPIEIAKLVHDKEYLKIVKNLPILDRFLGSSNQSVTYETNDMFWNKHTSTCALLAAGSVNMAVEMVLSGKCPASFALVRPPGHHAGTKCAEGFSWLNNVAIAARDALKRYTEQVKKVVIFDWDVHHGNGTQSIFNESKDVLYISLHRYGLGFYPGTGHAMEVGMGEGEGYSLNIPWRQRRLGDAEYMAAFEAVVKPVVRQFCPDLFLVSAGFDATEGDLLGQMEVSPACFGWMAAELFTLAGKRNCVFALEGGYCLDALSKGVIACVDAVGRASNGIHKVEHERIDADSKENADIVQLTAYCLDCKGGALETLKKVCQIQKKYWSSLEQSLSVIETALDHRKEVKLNRKEIERNAAERNEPSGDEDGGSYFSGLGALSNFMNELYEAE